MAAKTKRSKKHTPKKTANKRPTKKPVAQQAASKPAAPAQTEPTVTPNAAPGRTPLLISLIVVVLGFALTLAIVHSRQHTPVDNRSTSSNTPSTLQVMGTSDETGQLPSNGAANALQGQNNTGTTQSVPQAVQPTPDGLNLQAPPTRPEDVPGIN